MTLSDGSHEMTGRVVESESKVKNDSNVNMYVVLKVCIIYFVGDWSNGMIGVSKTFGGSSILSSPARNL